MKFIIDQSVIEFMAKIICDLGKAIITVGLATSFFEKFVLPLRISITIVGVAFLALSVILIMVKKGDA